MAPYIPDEVNVFNVPHSRMKELVNSYYALVESTNFSSVPDMSSLLESLYKTFAEFRTHEQIENELIMQKLQTKMRQLAQKNAAVCNCHKGSKLTKMMDLVKVGLSKSTAQDCINYGIKLRKELEKFTRSFIPHMQEEEEVFQPLLLEYFSYEELRQLKQAVIQQHLLNNRAHEQEVEKFMWSELPETEASTDSNCESDEVKNLVSINSLPSEIMVIILSLVSVQDRARCAQVCKTWNNYAYHQRFWRSLFPVHWSYGMWDNEDVSELVFPKNNASVQQEIRISNALCRVLLPSIGSFVRMLVLKGSSVVNDNMLQVMLKMCANIQHLDLSYCAISDEGLSSLHSESLSTLILSGCVNVSDVFLIRCFVCSRSSKGTTQFNGCPLPPDNDRRSCRGRGACCKLESNSGCSISAGLDKASKCLRNKTAAAVVVETAERLQRISIEQSKNEPSSSECLRSSRKIQPLPHPLQHLNLSGCWRVTDASLFAISRRTTFASLCHVDLSGCFQLSNSALRALVGVCPSLDPGSLYYCDNVVDGPYASVASGCQNLECSARVCCRTGV